MNYDITDYLKDDKELQKAVIQELLTEISTLQGKLDAFQMSENEANEIIVELKAENERLSSWLASSEKQRKEVCNVIHKKKEQIQTLKYMLFDEKEIPKDKFTMYYRIAQNERRTKSHRDLCTNIVKKYKQTLQEIKEIAEADVHIVGDEKFYYDSIEKILQVITKAESER